MPKDASREERVVEPMLDTLPISRVLYEETTRADTPDWRGVVAAMLNRARALKIEAEKGTNQVEAARREGQASSCFWDACEVALEAGLPFPWESLEELVSDDVPVQARLTRSHPRI